MKNSIEEDIELLQDETSSLGLFFKCKGSEKYKIALEHILLDYKRVLKENEEFKEYNMEYKRILDLADNRIYRKKYLEERRKEQPNLLYPDGDEIYQRYYELKQENEYNKLLLDTNKNFTIDKKNGNYKWNVIEIQKVKDKIEKYKNMCISNVKGYENYFKDNYNELVFRRMEQLEKELLESEE